MVLDEHGNVLLSTKVDNDETALLELIGTVAGIAAWAMLRDHTHYREPDTVTP